MQYILLEELRHDPSQLDVDNEMFHDRNANQADSQGPFALEEGFFEDSLFAHPRYQDRERRAVERAAILLAENSQVQGHQFQLTGDVK